MQLTDFDTDLFLRDYWQQKPLLIRNPWADWHNPLDPDELAGLACEAGVESRLVTQAGGDWKLEQGPLAEDRFATLGKSAWTLLVQAVDHHVPEVAALIDPFRFIPNWRIDDVMVSYAADGGGVGPHFDQYDVFLVQGLGQRRWRVGPLCDHASPLLPHDDLRLLAEFEAVDEWVLGPGDILYVPPRFAHDGVAVGDDCMTYSIGFRAPARTELMAHWCDHLLAELQEEDRYGDPGLARQANPGEIGADALARLHAMVTERLQDRDAFARWFGEYNSTPKYPDVDWEPEQWIGADDVRDALSDGQPLCRNPASRFAFIRQAEGVLLFVDGETFDCTGDAAALAEAVCAGDGVTPGADLSDRALDLIADLVNQGSLAFGEED
ncbi:cupin domain-containing protein [Sphingobium sufflavum]|uniref:cupin domain-containing protein n=1 Tax=Sphingobium sufflavum TaxID=1129547 RepID=UPI001F455AD9|nr:cupin domain-containing protein [Sphingobium sufflavum]MCE7796673.1 cupin domain-containing protein [Sphingobium sufflavum]